MSLPEAPSGEIEEDAGEEEEQAKSESEDEGTGEPEDNGYGDKEEAYLSAEVAETEETSIASSAEVSEEPDRGDEVAIDQAGGDDLSSNGLAPPRNPGSECAIYYLSCEWLGSGY